MNDKIQTSFVFESRVRVVFGVTALTRLPTELDTLGIQRVLLITTSGRGRTSGDLQTQLGNRLAGICDLAAMHVPADRVRAALEQVDLVKPDALLSFGGGSAIGLAKAIA